MAAFLFSNFLKIGRLQALKKKDDMSYNCYIKDGREKKLGIRNPWLKQQKGGMSLGNNQST